MIAVVQRVSEASVAVDHEVVGAIGHGLCVLLGVAVADRASDADAMADKLAKLRIFPDDAGRMNRSVAEIGGSLLVVSQFTLLGDVERGNRPSFVAAAPPEAAEPLYRRVVERLSATHGLRVASGRFRTAMRVALVNDGPVTIVLRVGGR
jgi:D-tyrosyl-tRNA(Tyr) deacylase